MMLSLYKIGVKLIVVTEDNKIIIIIIIIIWLILYCGEASMGCTFPDATIYAKGIYGSDVTPTKGRWELDGDKRR